MAKVPFSKLQASVNGAVTKMSYANKAGEQIVYEVKTYLPIKEKLEVVSNIINAIAEEIKNLAVYKSPSISPE